MCVYVSVSVCLCAGSNYTGLLVLQLSTVLHMVSEWRSLRMRVFKIVEGGHNDNGAIRLHDTYMLM